MKRRFLINFGIAFLVFTVLAVFFSSESYFFYLLKGEGPHFWEDFGWTMMRWIPWAFFTPVIVWLVRWFPLDRKKWYTSMPLHATASVLFSFIQSSFFLFYSCVYELTWFFNGKTLVEYFIKFFHLNFLTYLVTIGVCYLFEYYRKHRENELKASRLETQLTQSQLEVLKMQLHPHFLFNTLHAISALMHADVDTADAMVSRMSALLRMSLESSGVQEVPLKRELESLRIYLDIEKMRLGDRLEIDLKIGRETLDANVPNFFLLPLLESIIRLKIAPRRSGGKVTLLARREQDRLRIEIDDHGNGWAKSVESQEQKKMTLQNTRERLQQLYGPEHRLVLREEGSLGPFLVVEIPFREAAE